MSDELPFKVALPCPFCGSKLVFPRAYPPMQHSVVGFAVCTECGARGPKATAEDPVAAFQAALDKWDERAPAEECE